MHIRHQLLSLILMAASAICVWAGSALYFEVFFPLQYPTHIAPAMYLLGCSVLGLIILAARWMKKIKKDWVVDVILLALFIVAALTGPDFARLYIWIAGFAFLFLPIFSFGDSRQDKWRGLPPDETERISDIGYSAIPRDDD
ncbi:hypothetical protein [Maritalea myrionectae]|uniref:hypothetical protein n=1 Tax=Maritalea myrionectae TaxID=454601 RepID=UPI0004895C48|nr:hypothetical protein [Maritalea myrionectae]